LSRHPELEATLRQEIQDKIGENDPTWDNLTPTHMPYLHSFITESLRLHPPVPLDIKVAEQADVLPSGESVAAGEFVGYVPYAMARQESIYEAADNFDPKRWLDEKERIKPVNQFKFPVFQAGPRICLGINMAYLEVKMMVVMILRKFSLKGDPSHQATYNTSVTLFMKGGFPCTVTPAPEGLR